MYQLLCVVGKRWAPALVNAPKLMRDPYLQNPKVPITITITWATQNYFLIVGTWLGLKKNQNAPRPSEDPPVRGVKLSKRFGGMLNSENVEVPIPSP